MRRCHQRDGGNEAATITVPPTRIGSPAKPIESLDQIEVLVSAQNGQGVLAAERRNPRVIGGDRGTGRFELDAQLRIPNGGFVIDLEHARDGDELLQPALVLTPVSRLGNSEPAETTRSPPFRWRWAACCTERHASEYLQAKRTNFLIDNPATLGA